MGLGDFWRTSQRADDFLRTGRTDNARDLLRNPGDSFIIKDSNDNWVGGGPAGGGGTESGGTTGCHSSIQCPSGHACVDGICQYMNSGGQNQQNSPGSGCDPEDRNSPCNKGGSGSCQQTANCGDTGGQDCCGTRCCSFGSAASARPGVHCWCSECPPMPTCSDFCTAYLAANGEPGPGCAEGENGNSCDSCSYCEAAQCKRNTFNPPCWCEGSECNAANCEKCITDPESFDYGDCEFDGSNCQQCGTITNHVCPCNKILPPITKCTGYYDSGPLGINLAQQEAAKQCEELCKVEPDPCDIEPAKVKRCCFPDYGDCTFPSCDSPGTFGFVEVASDVDENGYGCVTCQELISDKLPEECFACDCNCHDDCPNCELCGADGKCYPDPACEDVLVDLYVTYNIKRSASSCCFSNCYCYQNLASSSSTLVAQGITATEASKYSLQYETSGINPINICRQCEGPEDNRYCEGSNSQCAVATKYVSVHGPSGPTGIGYRLEGCWLGSVCVLTSTGPTEQTGTATLEMRRAGT